MYTGKIELFNWTEEKRQHKNFVHLIATVRTGCYPYMTIKKMSNIRLERFVTKLVEHSRHEFYNGTCMTAEKIRPEWWPKYLKFTIPLKKLKTTVNNRKWGPTLRDVIESCSKFYKIQFPYNLEAKREFIKSKTVSYFDSRISTTSEDNPAYRVNDQTIAIKKTVNVNSLKQITSLGVKLPVVKLFDITKGKQFLQSLKVPIVKLVDVQKLSVKVKTKRKRKSYTTKINKSFSELSTKRVCVRLNDIFEKPKDVQYSKDDYMNYFSLGRVNRDICSLSSYSKPILSTILRNNTIPISSDLARCALQSKTVSSKYESSWKTQKLEWYLKELPQVTNVQYSVTYSSKEDLDKQHNYRFPKRQQHQNHQNLKLYSCLKKCKHAYVKLERLNLNNLKKKYVHS